MELVHRKIPQNIVEDGGYYDFWYYLWDYSFLTCCVFNSYCYKGWQMLYFFTRSEDTEVGLSYAGICIIHIIPLIHHRNNPVIMFIIAALVGNMLAGLLISTKKLPK